MFSRILSKHFVMNWYISLMAGFIYQKVSGEASWLSVRGYQILKFAGTSMISFEFPFSNLVDILLMTYLFI